MQQGEKCSRRYSITLLHFECGYKFPISIQSSYTPKSDLPNLDVLQVGQICAVLVHFVRMLQFVFAYRSDIYVCWRFFTSTLKIAPYESDSNNTVSGPRKRNVLKETRHFFYF